MQEEPVKPEKYKAPKEVRQHVVKQKTLGESAIRFAHFNAKLFEDQWQNHEDKYYA